LGDPTQNQIIINRDEMAEINEFFDIEIEKDVMLIHG
jgi:hypothetical protein